MPVTEWDKELDLKLERIKDRITYSVMKIMRDKVTNGAFEHVLDKILKEESTKEAL